MWRKVVLISLGLVAAIVVAAGAASQLLVPGITEHRIEDRLTRSGGSASVSVHAFPAAQLLFDEGDRIDVHGTGLDLELEDEQQPRVLERLDGFDNVDVTLATSRAGPLDVRSFKLTRSGSGLYHLEARAETTPEKLAVYGASRLGLPVGPLLFYVTGKVPRAAQPIPIDLDMMVRSESGRAIVVSGGGTIARFPTGPLAQLITEAIVVRL